MAVQLCFHVTGNWRKSTLFLVLAFESLFSVASHFTCSCCTDLCGFFILFISLKNKVFPALKKYKNNYWCTYPDFTILNLVLFWFSAELYVYCSVTHKHKYLYLRRWCIKIIFCCHLCTITKFLSIFVTMRCLIEELYKHFICRLYLFYISVATKYKWMHSICSLVNLRQIVTVKIIPIFLWDLCWHW